MTRSLQCDEFARPETPAVLVFPTADLANSHLTGKLRPDVFGEAPAANADTTKAAA